MQFPNRESVRRPYDGRAKNRIGLVSALPGDPVRGTTAAVIIPLLALMVFGAVITAGMPYTPDDAIEASSRYAVSDMYVLSCPSGDAYEGKVLEMHVDPDDFRHSMGRHMFRQGTCLVPDADAMVDPDDPYVMQVAEHIRSETAGLSDIDRITAALAFVQCSIQYSYDSDLYGREEFWASPLETLYLHRGDCEDTSILFCSIVLAMGYDCVLLHYLGHVAAGVFLGDSEEPYLCETTHFYPVPPSEGIGDAEYHHPEGEGLAGEVNDLIARYTDILRLVTGA